MAHGKPGRPWKGHRHFLRAELPVDLVAALKARARGEGKSVTDLVGEMVAREVGMRYDPTPNASSSA